MCPNRVNTNNNIRGADISLCSQGYICCLVIRDWCYPSHQSWLTSRPPSYFTIAPIASSLNNCTKKLVNCTWLRSIHISVLSLWSMYLYGWTVAIMAGGGNGCGYDGQQKYTICDTCRQCHSILSKLKPVFRRIWQIHCVYNSLRCLDRQIWWFL